MTEAELDTVVRFIFRAPPNTYGPFSISASTSMTWPSTPAWATARLHPPGRDTPSGLAFWLQES